MSTNNDKKRNDEDMGNVRGVSPIGEAVWPKLVDPETRFDPDGTYSLKLRLADGDEADKLIGIIDATAQRAYDEAVENAPNPVAKKKVKKADPSYARELDRETGEDTGHWLFNFKMKASGTSKKTGKPWSRRPAIFDSKGTPMMDLKSNDDIWNGTLVRVAYELRPFYSPSFGAGCSQVLQAVQVIKLVQGNGGKDAGSFGFAVEDGGYEAPSYDTPMSVEPCDDAALGDF